MATELYTHATHVPFMAKYVFDLPKINRSKKRQINTVTVIAGRTISSKEKIKNKKEIGSISFTKHYDFSVPGKTSKEESSSACSRLLSRPSEYYHIESNIYTYHFFAYLLSEQIISIFLEGERIFQFSFLRIFVERDR